MYICKVMKTKRLKTYLSQRTNNAVLALICMVRNMENGPMQVSEVAAFEKLSKRSLEVLFLELRKNGILGSCLGKNGGYYLLRKPKEISLLDIVQIFETTNPVFSKETVNNTFLDENLFQANAVFQEIRNFAISKLKNTNLETLVNRDNIGYYFSI